MRRYELEHIIRAAAANSDTDEIVVVGSQAILGSFPDAPAELLISVEADVFPRKHPERSDIIEGIMGENSMFHDTFGYYANGVGATTAKVPIGWESRLVPICNENTRNVTGWCLEPHDLAVSKLVAGREKDFQYLVDLIGYQLVKPELVLARLREVPELQPAVLQFAEARLGRIIKAAAGRT